MAKWNNRKSQTEQQQVIDLSKPIVVDGTNLIAGRLASNVAKLLRKGNRVSVVNCDKIMMSGKKASIVGEYEEFLKINSIINYKHGPKHPRRPDTVIARMIRGMLPYEDKPSGKTGFLVSTSWFRVGVEISSLLFETPDDLYIDSHHEFAYIRG